LLSTSVTHYTLTYAYSSGCDGSVLSLLLSFLFEWIGNVHRIDLSWSYLIHYWLIVWLSCILQYLSRSVVRWLLVRSQ